MKNPLVSVIMPSYNHQDYIGQAIESVLYQDYQNFEFLISDDNSPDNSVDVIKKFNDDRISLNVFKKNQGAALNTHYLIDHSKGKYLALINSDDVWMKGKLKKQVAFLENHPEYAACFSWAKLIDENNNILDEEPLVFKQKNREQSQWIQHLFTNGNCICHPSMLIRKEVYDSLGKYSISMRQLPDFYMWTKVTKHYNIYVMQESMVLHRRFVNQGENTSAPSLHNSIRDINESYFILSSFFDNIDDSLFIESFSFLFRDESSKTPEELICEKFFLMLDKKYYMKPVSKIAAINFYYQECDTPKIIQLLNEKYNFSLNDFYELSGSSDLVGLQPVLKTETQESSFPFVDDYIMNNRLRSISIAILGIDSKAYKFFKKIYLKFKK